MTSRRRRFWVETSLAGASGLLGIVTIFWHDWIEVVFKVDPDHGNGAAEWLVVVVLLGVAVILAIGARYELRQMRRSAAVTG